MKRLIFRIIKRFILYFMKILSTERETMYLGTEYGGWHFIKPKYNSKLNIFSAGVGEDVSFDIELLNNFNADIYFVDPTPRALEHMENVVSNLGNTNSREYNNTSGKQPIEAYNLKNISKNQIKIIDKALFNKHGLKVKFFLPKNKKHVSHSISNFQNNFSNSTDHIFVETTTLEKIINEFNVDYLDVLKLDIEGAEIEVLNKMLSNRIFPDQILVEFDELNTNSLNSYMKIFFVVIRLILNNYKSVNINDYPNYLFVNKKLFKSLK